MTAATGRPDYDQAVKLSTLSPGEPIFVLRAGDACAADTVRAWATLAHAAGAPLEAVELALQQADRMEQWPDRKTPDGPDLTEAQRLDLRNSLARRAWRAKDMAPTPEIVMAEQLGRSAVLGPLRSELTALTAVIKSGEPIAVALRRLFRLAGRDYDAALAAD